MSVQYSIAQRIRIYKGDVTYARWQNYFVAEKIDEYEYQPFGVSTIQVNRSADEGGITIEGPSSTRFLNQFTESVNDQHIVFVELLQMTDGAKATDFSSFHVVAAFTGVALTMTNNLTQTRLSVGAAINAISGDVPGRKMTSSLVGVLPTL